MCRSTLLVFAAAALAAGCAGRVGYSAGASVEGPDLVYAAPGVQVIADYDEPIFYSDNFYWRYDGSVWYRSSYYTGGWVTMTPPSVIVQIDQPRRFVHYRPQGWVAHRSNPRRPGPVVNDHRDDHRVAPTRSNAPPHVAPQPPHATRPRETPRHEPPKAPPHDKDHRDDHDKH